MYDSENKHTLIFNDSINPIVVLTTMGFDHSDYQVLSIVLERGKVLNLKPKRKSVKDGKYRTMFFILNKKQIKLLKTSKIKHIIFFDIKKEKKIYFAYNKKLNYNQLFK